MKYIQNHRLPTFSKIRLLQVSSPESCKKPYL
nr:MAG TPA: hypothetical protein [Caudoviricetes sp.]